MHYLRLLRVHQWVKNLFLFIPAFFAVKITDSTILLPLLLAFTSFCLISSAVYIINDYADLEKDKLHPTKKLRPLAAGSISKPTALVILSICFLLAFLLAAYLSSWFALCCTIYFILNIAYSFGLKNLALFDITIISSGFIIRLIAGGIVASVHLSHWLMLITFMGALLLGFAKRRDDFLILQNTGSEMRKSIKGYNLEFIQAGMVLCGTVAVVAYIMYTISPEVVARVNTPYLYITSFFIVLGVLRYLQITLVENKSGSPTKILYTDLSTQILILCWLLSFAFFLYIKKWPV